MNLETKLMFMQDCKNKMCAYSLKANSFPKWRDPFNDLNLLKQQQLDLNNWSQFILNEEEIEYTLNLALKRYLLEELLYKVTLRLRSETDYLVVYDEMVSLSNKRINKHALNDYLITLWGTPVEINGIPAAGVYYSSGKIKITEPEPTTEQRLRALALSGNIPKADKNYTHEKTHALQHFPKKTNLITELKEAHAYRIGEGTVLNVSHLNLAKFILSNPLYPNTDSNKMNYAIWAIDRLHALNYNQASIIFLIQNPGVWNEKDNYWTNFEADIEAKRLEKNMSYEELEEAVLTYELRCDINRLKAQAITQAVLYDSFKDDISRKHIEDKTRLFLFHNPYRIPVH